MSKPIINIINTPESYSPKNKPEILNMMNESTDKIKMIIEYEVKAANGGSYILMTNISRF